MQYVRVKPLLFLVYIIQSFFLWNNSIASELNYEIGDEVFLQACGSDSPKYYSRGKVLNNLLREVPNTITAVETSPYSREFLTEAKSTIELDNGSIVTAHLTNFRDFQVLDASGVILYDRKVSGATSIYEIQNQGKTVAWGVGWHKNCKVYYGHTEFTAFRVILPTIKKGVQVEDKLFKGAYITRYIDQIINKKYPILVQSDHTYAGYPVCYYCAPRFFRLNSNEGFQEIKSPYELKALGMAIDEVDPLFYVSWLSRYGLKEEMAEYIINNFDALDDWGLEEQVAWHYTAYRGEVTKKEYYSIKRRALRKEKCMELVKNPTTISDIGNICFPLAQSSGYFYHHGSPDEYERLDNER